MRRGEWEKLGEVVSGPQDTMAVGGKQHLGQTWDYVFDVDIADGAPVKKLPANKGEDPYVAADRFLEQEQLPLSYRCSCSCDRPSCCEDPSFLKNPRT